jgi:hypothetical protein
MPLGRYFSTQEIILALYRGILGRDPDVEGFAGYRNAIDNGESIDDIIRLFMNSSECLSYNNLVKIGNRDLPDLTKLFHDKYPRSHENGTIFYAKTDDDFNLMELLIAKHHYYDHFGVWTPEIDFDKRLTAAIVEGLGARSCIELGCFTGPVLSVLSSHDVEVCGVEVSHLAFLKAHANIKNKLRFGTLLDVEFGQKFDVFLGMDVLEHLNPLYFDGYLSKIRKLVEPQGFAYINSPMIGQDDVFGEPFDRYLPEWQEADDEQLWRHMVCDALGWPIHGHLVWASPKWWEAQFEKHGLVRDRSIEHVIHDLLDEPFFKKEGLGRKSLFVLKHSGHEPDVQTICEKLSASITSVLQQSLPSSTIKGGT